MSSKEVEWGRWSVWHEDICFLNNEAMPQPAIESFNIVSRQRRRLASVEQKSRIAPAHGGLAVSPDGQWILFGSMDQMDNDVMLVENFR